MENISVMPARIERQQLIVLSAVGLFLYSFVALIGSAFAYESLSPWFLSSVLAFAGYLLFCLLTAIFPLSHRLWKSIGLSLHIAAAPCAVFTFFFMGVPILLLVGFYWFRFYQAFYGEGDAWWSRNLI